MQRLIGNVRGRRRGGVSATSPRKRCEAGSPPASATRRCRLRWQPSPSVLRYGTVFGTARTKMARSCCLVRHHNHRAGEGAGSVRRRRPRL